MSILRIFRPLRPDLLELRGMADELPLGVRIAMMRGVACERIIAGAYTDNDGGVCPMLAAHRQGARHSHPDFARTWDEFAEAPVEGHRDAHPEHVAALTVALRSSIESALREDDDEHTVPAAVLAPSTRPSDEPQGTQEAARIQDELEATHAIEA